MELYCYVREEYVVRFAKHVQSPIMSIKSTSCAVKRARSDRSNRIITTKNAPLFILTSNTLSLLMWRSSVVMTLGGSTNNTFGDRLRDKLPEYGRQNLWSEKVCFILSKRKVLPYNSVIPPIELPYGRKAPCPKDFSATQE
jgi:hypothetical protein